MQPSVHLRHSRCVLESIYLSVLVIVQVLLPVWYHTAHSKK